MDEVLARARGMEVLRDMVDVVARARAISRMQYVESIEIRGPGGRRNAIRENTVISVRAAGRSYLIGDEQRGRYTHEVRIAMRQVFVRTGCR